MWSPLFLDRLVLTASELHIALHIHEIPSRKGHSLEIYPVPEAMVPGVRSVCFRHQGSCDDAFHGLSYVRLSRSTI